MASVEDWPGGLPSSATEPPPPSLSAKPPVGTTLVMCPSGVF